MKIIIETSSQLLFESRCQEIQKLLQDYPDVESLCILEDNVGYGNVPDELVLSIIFVAKAIGDGLAYDAFKLFLQKMKSKIIGTHNVIQYLPKTQCVFYCEDDKTQKRFRIEVDSNRENIEVILPDKSRIIVKTSDK